MVAVTLLSMSLAIVGYRVGRYFFGPKEMLPIERARQPIPYGSFEEWLRDVRDFNIPVETILERCGGEVPKEEIPIGAVVLRDPGGMLINTPYTPYIPYNFGNSGPGVIRVVPGDVIRVTVTNSSTAPVTANIVYTL